MSGYETSSSTEPVSKSTCDHCADRLVRVLLLVLVLVIASNAPPRSTVVLTAGPSSKAAEEQLLHLLTPFVLLHRYPRSLIQLTLQTLSTPSTAFTHAFSTALEIDDDRDKGKQANARRSLGVGAGAAESAARINAAMLALVDAGIECTSMLVAVAAAIVSPSQHDGSTDDGDDDELLLDPTPEEESRAKSTHVFVFAFGAASGNTPTRTESENDAVASAGDCVGAHSLGQFNAEQVSRSARRSGRRTATQADESSRGSSPSLSLSPTHTRTPRP